MPELPEVETMARDLRDLVSDAQIIDTWVTHPKMLRHPDPDAFRAGLRGQRISSLGRRAKSLIVGIGTARALVIAPIMTGHIDVVPAGAVRARHAHLGLTLADGREVRLSDPRRFARFGLYPRRPDGQIEGPTGSLLFDHIGPEPDDLTPEDFAHRLRARPVARRPIKGALLDQAVLAGVGNIYADEVLWATMIHPRTPAGALTDDRVTELMSKIREKFEEGIANRGAGVRDYAPPLGGSRMQDRLVAYGHAGRACPRCGTTMIREVVAGRGTVWCPTCQTVPSVD